MIAPWLGIMDKATRLRKRVATLIQVTALLFLQAYSILPGFSDFVASPRHGDICRGDHQICGCPLEKIANLTCCCFKSADLAKSLMEQNKSQTGSMSGADINRMARFVSPPCGDHPDINITSIEKIIFLRFAAAPEGPDFLSALNPAGSGDPLRTRSNEPPDPPPKFYAA